MSTINPIWLQGQRLRANAAEGEARARAAAEQDAFEREVLALRREFASLKLEYELRRFQQKYSPNQPRMPAGSREGGQWTSAGGGAGTRLADAGDTSRSHRIVLSDASPDPIRPGARLANVIRICMAGSGSVGTDRWGNQRYWSEYTCADGYAFKKYGVGGKIPAFVTDPRF